ncbi:M2 family metallopeptidase [Melghirimyces algeriensis]|uniref:Peptidyl-dipeptidase A n=1 Tax=Melghirimyces algeriensis TaxID=910412 RepID=A0A521ANG7_9BACL|nr:M2 family metallopeptidase [Melghirimyces algeriensis]SMO36342.1 peptidyl-dipeptidase A [Melghirimyces algeriensis]
MNSSVQSFLDEVVSTVQSIDKRMAKAYWKFATTGKREEKEAYARLLKERIRFFSDPQRFEKLEAMRKQTENPSLEQQQLDLLYQEFMFGLLEPEEMDRMVELISEIELAFIHFRAVDQERSLSENDIHAMLRTETDTYKRKRLWKAGQEVGSLVAEQVLELIHLRNQTARKKGYADFYQMLLELNGWEEKGLFHLLDQLKEATDQPFSDAKQELDKVVAKPYRFLRPEGIRPWHYADLTFRTAPAICEPHTDAWWENINLEDQAIQTFQGMGLDIAEILQRSDLYEREGKSQHAFCMDLDGAGDIRILCNLRSDAYSMRTLLHTLGYAVYAKFQNGNLPWLLRKATHEVAKEAVALIMDRLLTESAWLKRIKGGSSDEWMAEAESLKKQAVLDRLVYVRWCLARSYFERDLYKDPDRDLDSIWWDDMEPIQFVPRPEYRNAPDWAAQIHFVTQPLYCPNALLGEMMASQILESMKKRFPDVPHPLVENPDAGHFLKEQIFDTGMSSTWDQILKLNPDDYIRYVVPEGKA